MTSTRGTTPLADKVVLALLFLLIPALLGAVMPTDDVAASHANIKFPFEPGRSWTVLQGYNTDPSSGGTHYNCDPATLRDTVRQAVSCSAPWQYRYSLDFYESSNRSAGLTVLSPVSGTVRWTQASTGGVSINLGDGYAVALFHVILDPGIDTGTVLTQGQRIGTVAPVGVAGAGNNPHIHMTLWQTTDGGNWSRTAVPFTDASAIDGVSFPDLGTNVFNQHRGTHVYSTNQPIGPGELPAPPAAIAPAPGATIANGTNGVEFSWQPVPGATSYLVVIHNVGYSGWTSGTNWTSGPLPPGTYTWNVESRNARGESGWNQTRSFTVTNGMAAPAISLSASRGSAGTVVSIAGTGFNSGEPIDLRWDSATASPIAYVVANGNGAFSTQFTIPNGTKGAHTIYARGSRTAKVTAAPFEIIPSLSRTPTEGAPGTRVTVTVRGFGANEQVNLTWGSASGSLVGAVRTNAVGTGTVSISIPNGRPGWTDYVGTGQTTRAVGYGAINVLSRLYLSPVATEAGGTAKADAGGITPNTAYTVTFNGVTVCSGTSSADGIVRCTYQVPRVGAGGYAVVVKVGTVTLSGTMVVTGPPSVSASPAERQVGVNITLTAGGFTPNETVTFAWDNGSWQRSRADAYGSVTLPATVPAGAKGAHTITARGASSGRTATSTYLVGDGGNVSGSSMIRPGVYSVFATREGLVGGTTSSGHVIVENDYFVALPGCTPSNCKGNFTPGNMTQCGTKCYVKVINPVTNVCRVEPILDTGPWFTVDDWWNPTSTRYLNNLASNPNTLAQGYPGAEAARNGLDVGYGLGPNGIGRDNTGTIPGRQYREVGNPAAIDLADGTWYALAPQGNAVGATITVEMIWQTGADPGTEAARCGHPLNQPGGTPVSFPPGTANPTLSGSKLAVTSVSDTPSTGTASRVIDNNGATGWNSPTTTPSYASITLDLGADRSISGVKWLVATTGRADSFSVTVRSTSGQVTNLGQFGNPPGNYQWYGVSKQAVGRYVILTFANPNRDASLGSLAEVAVWGSPIVTNPSGTSNPSFTGSKAIPRAASDAPATGRGPLVLDGNQSTNWYYSGSGYPAEAKLLIDLGDELPLTGIKWKMATATGADQFQIKVYGDGSVYRGTVGTFGNPGTLQAWYGIQVGGSPRVRYVEFTFTNPNRDLYLGSVAEVEIWHTGPVSNPAGTANPLFIGTEMPVANSWDTPDTGRSIRTYDDNPGTNWYYSGSGYPGRSGFILDLGDAVPLSGVKWRVASLGYADQFVVTLYGAQGNWLGQLGTFGNPGTSQSWYGIAVQGAPLVRYVEFSFTNPNRDLFLGSFSEVEVWQNGAPVNPRGVRNPIFPGTKSAIASSWDSPNTGRSGRAYDNNQGTNWYYSGSGYPTRAGIVFDLGSARQLSGIKWKVASLGYADQFVINLYGTGGNWIGQVGTYGNPGSSQTWYGVPITSNAQVRYIEFSFTNPNRDLFLGSFSEVEVWSATTNFSAASVIAGQPDPDLAGAPLPVTCVADPATSDPQHAGVKACDLDGGTAWHTDPTTPATVTLTVSLDAAQEITGIKWNFAQQGGAAHFDVSIGHGDAEMSLGSYAGGAPGAYEGIPAVPGTVADRVILTFTNVDGAERLGQLAEIEVWGPGVAPAGTPVASPVPATPEPVVGTPDASPIPVETETPAASPAPADGTPVPATAEPTEDAASPEPVATEIPATPEPVIRDVSPTVEPPATEAPTEAAATPVPATEEPTSLPTEPAMLAPTDAPSATATVEPTAAPTEAVTPEPTAAVTVGTITGTDGDLVNCRLSPIDGEPITQLTEGDTVDITGSAVDGWLPVVCAGQPGYVSEAFVTIGEVTPTEVVKPTATTEWEPTVDPTTVTAEPTPEPTPEPTLEPTAAPVETPYPVVDAADSGDSGTAWNVVDGDPGSAWLVTAAEDQVRLRLDLGSVQPIDRVTIELAWTGSLPYFELWLSENGETWYNATPNGIDGWSLSAGEPIAFDLGYDARFIRLVVPFADESGLGEVGGIAEIAVWPGDITQTRYLSALGSPTTPIPAPEPTEEPTFEPTEEVLPDPTEKVIESPTPGPTDEVIEEPTEEWIEEPTDEPLPEDQLPDEETVG